MGKNHQFWLVKTQLELGLIFRTRIRLGTQFLILLMYGTGIKREREREPGLIFKRRTRTFFRTKPETGFLVPVTCGTGTEIVLICFREQGNERFFFHKE